MLDISLQKNSSFHVGKIDFLKLYPMNLIEFLENSIQKLLAKQLSKNKWVIIDAFHEKLTEQYRLYYYIGGMTEVVSNYIQNKDFESVRHIQKRIILG